MKKHLLRLWALCSVLLCSGLVHAQSYSNEALNITWGMADGATSKAVATPAAAILSSSWSIGSNLAIDATATGTYFEKTFTRFTRVGDSKLDNKREVLDDSYIGFKFKPFAGITLTPTKLSFDITKVGTGDPNIWVECIQGTTTTSIAENVTIRKNSESTPSEHLSYDLKAFQNIVGTSDDTEIRIYIGKLANNKQVGLANVVVEGTIDGTIQKYTTVYNIAKYLLDNNKTFEGNTGTIPATAEAGANAFDMKVDATSGKLGKNNDWAQFNKGTVLTIPGVPQGAKVSFTLYNDTKITIAGVNYGNGDIYTATKDINLKMSNTTANGYIQKITVEGTPFVSVLDADGYSNVWQFGKGNGAEEFKLEKSAEYTYTVDGRSLVINSSAGKLNNASRTDEWAQCNDGTRFKVPVYEGSKLSWRKYNGGDQTGFTIDGVLYNDYYVATAEGTAEMTAMGISYLSNIKIEPEPLYEVTGTISGGTIDNASIIFTSNGNKQTYSAVISSSAFTIKVPADTYTLDLSGDVAYVVSTPETVTVSESNTNAGAITIVSAQPQTVTGKITNAPAEAFTLTFTGASHNKQVECTANATSYTVTLEPDNYAISSNVGTLSTLSKQSFKVLKEAVTHNIYFPETVPAATQQNITVDNTAIVAANVYQSISDALAAAKAGNISKPVITLTSGQTYKEQVKVDIADVTLKTSGEEPATITWYYGIGYCYYSLDADGYYNKDRAMTHNTMLKVHPARWGATVLVTNKGNNFKAENIIFENSFNQRYTAEEVADGVKAVPMGDTKITYDRTLTEGAEGYRAADTKEVTERAAAIGFENNPSGCQLYKCKFIGSQDTFYSSGKLYVKNCDIQGNTDYIFGGGQVVFDNCNLVIGGYSDKKTSAYITAQKGNTGEAYIFRDCTVKAANREYILANLGRDWGGASATVYYFNLKNEIGNDLEYKWNNMGGGVNDGTANLHIYDFDATINANYSTTGKDGANINGVLSDDNALSIYADVINRLGFTPEHIYEDKLVFDENIAYNACRIAANNNVKRNVNLSRELAASQWNTIVLPFALTAEQISSTFGAGTKVAELSSGDASVLNFVTTTAMEANKPYIINVAADFTSADINEVTIIKADATQSSGDWTLTGTYAAAKIPAASYFFNANKVNKASDGTTDIKPFNAYLTNAAANEVTFTIDGVPTGITSIVNDNLQDAEAIYNLQGVRVDKATKDVYIINGKKVVIK